MKILFCGSNLFDEHNYRNSLKEVAEGDSVYFVYEIHQATDFISNYLVKNQGELDLIVIHKEFDDYFSNTIISNIQNDDLSTYSKKDFNLASLPYLQLFDREENISIYRKPYPNSENTYDYGIENFSTAIDRLINVVKEWRKAVIGELDNLGIQYNSGKVDYSFYFSSRRKKKVETKILSDNFRLFPRKLNYAWLEPNEKQIQINIDHFIKLLKGSESIGTKGEEKKYHQFFIKNPYFILRDNFKKYWYETKLSYSAKRYFEPDFSLKPNLDYRTDLNILEIKLPNEGFIKKTKFHPSPYQKLMSHIFQVNDYKDYLESGEHNREVNNSFGYIPSRIDYNILIGRKKDKEENEYFLTKRMRQMGAENIRLLTYDELLDYQVKYLERINLLKID
ncbi:MAG: Shedu anti-phage system protein SduA domain-containing protein [Bacteroidota bacterium]